MRKSPMVVLFLVLAGAALQGCVGARTFHEVARAGDTVAVAAGWKQHFTRDNITVRITPSSGAVIVFPPNSPAIRAVVNLYPDPVSSILVSQETGQDVTPYAQTYADMVTANFTQGDKDWWQTSVFVDLPSNLPAGSAEIDISTPEGESASSVVRIVSGTGSPNAFQTAFGSLNDNQLLSMQRARHYTVNLAGSTVPYAVQLDLLHAPDTDHGGAGRTHVINPRGDLKNLSWRDDGTNLRVLLMPAKGSAPGSMKDFKFYVAGGIAGLQVISVKPFDVNGNPLSGVTAVISME